LKEIYNIFIYLMWEAVSKTCTLWIPLSNFSFPKTPTPTIAALASWESENQNTSIDRQKNWGTHYNEKVLMHGGCWNKQFKAPHRNGYSIEKQVIFSSH
jgi:hypothetical protein